MGLHDNLKKESAGRVGLEPDRPYSVRISTSGGTRIRTISVL